MSICDSVIAKPCRTVSLPRRKVAREELSTNGSKLKKCQSSHWPVLLSRSLFRVQGPECGRSSDWVFAHWYETGTWSGTSCGVDPTHQPMAVEGQTRFRVDPVSLQIKELVVTRTFTEWETLLIAK